MFPQAILDLAHWPYFPAILGLQICPRCKHPSLLVRFWRMRNWCKHCQRCREKNFSPAIQESRKRWLNTGGGRKKQQAYARKYMRKYRHTLRGREQNRKDAHKERLRWPGRVKARRAVKEAIQSGRLIRQPCQVCGDPKAEAHHPDYNKPLEVIWLCGQDHKELHHSHLTAGEQSAINQILRGES